MTEFLTQNEFQRNCALLERTRALLQRIESHPQARESYRMTWRVGDGRVEVSICGKSFLGGFEDTLQAAVNYMESL